MAAQLVEGEGLGRRNYERFATLLAEKGMVGQPIKAILPNAEAIDPFKVPVGNVVEIAANSPLVSELIHRSPMAAVCVIDLKDDHVNSTNVASIVEKLKSVMPEMMVSKESFSLGLGDSEHWEANMVNGRFSVVRTKTQTKPKMTGASNHQLHKTMAHKGAHTPVVSTTSYLQSAFAEPEPSYSYSIVAVSEMSNELMQEYIKTIEASCQTVGEMAAHPSTQAIHSFLVRNNNRILYQVGEQMGWAFPCQVDASSFFHNKVEFSAPLMANPSHVQINNGITLGENSTVLFFNGAIDMLQNGGLESAFVDLGLDVGLVQFSAPIRRAALALPVSVRREALGRNFASTAKPLTTTIIGNNVDTSIMFKQGYYQKPTEQFISECQKLAGNTDELIVQPCIFTPIFTIVGDKYGEL